MMPSRHHRCALDGAASKPQRGALGVALCVALLVTTLSHWTAADCPPRRVDTAALSSKSLRAARPSKDSSTEGARPAEPRPAAIRRAIHAAAGYLTRACPESGKFIYRINLDPKRQVRPKYNVLRHAGALYALSEYQRRWPKAATKACLQRATSWLSQHIRPLPAAPQLLALWSSDRPEEAKLGGAGLALVALTGMSVTVRPPESALNRLSGFLRYMQRSDGSFYSKYFSQPEGRSAAFHSLYYPGEASLGLLKLDALRPDARSRNAATRALLELARRRRRMSRVPADHWALLATARRLAAPASLSRVQRERLTSHARQIAASMLSGRHEHAASSALHGSFLTQGRTTPTATRLEGLLAIMPWLRAPLRQRAEAAVQSGVQFLLRAQVQEGPHRGAVPRTFIDGAQAEGAAPRRSGEVRIDYVQHALSAWIQYLERCRTPQQPQPEEPQPEEPQPEEPQPEEPQPEEPQPAAGP